MRKIHIVTTVIIIILSSFFSVTSTCAAKLNSNSIALILGETYQLKVLDNEKTVTWYSSDKDVVAVNSKGKVRAKTVGKAIITANIGKQKYECEISVSKPKMAIMMNLSTDEYVKPTYITINSYNKLKKDMSYKEAVKTIGLEGNLVSKSNDKDGKIVSEVYTWYGEDGISNACVVFADGKLIEKEQIFLE